jgi:hypothetical protein
VEEPLCFGDSARNRSAAAFALEGRLAVSPDGRRLACGTVDHAVRVWDTASGAEVLVLRGHEDRVTCAVFAPGGGRLAAGAEDGVVRIWDSAGAEVAVLEGPPEAVADLQFSDDGRRLAVRSLGGTVRVWDGEGGEPACLRGLDRSPEDALADLLRAQRSLKAAVFDAPRPESCHRARRMLTEIARRQVLGRLDELTGPAAPPELAELVLGEALAVLPEERRLALSRAELLARLGRWDDLHRLLDRVRGLAWVPAESERLKALQRQELAELRRAPSESFGEGEWGERRARLRQLELRFRDLPEYLVLRGCALVEYTCHLLQAPDAAEPKPLLIPLSRSLYREYQQVRARCLALGPGALTEELATALQGADERMRGLAPKLLPASVLPSPELASKARALTEVLLADSPTSAAPRPQFGKKEATPPAPGPRGQESSSTAIRRMPLPPALLEYSTDHFALGEELQRLRRVQQVGTVEAEIFYAARILESLSAAALRAVRLPAAPNAFANLDVLQQLNLLPPAAGSWAHALRRSGNAVRHLQRRVDADEAELAVLFLERWLGWFFGDYRHGPRLADLPAGGLCLHDRADPALRALMLTLDQGTFHPDSLLVGAAAGQRTVLRSPALPAVAAERLLDRGDPEAARRLALAGLERFPDDLRLRQLVGLSYSRQKDLDQARRWLEPLLERYRDDEETIGITAGLFKRLADAQGDAAWMARAHQGYRRGWERSGQSNAYLGINAASTALFLGQDALARELAGGVRNLLQRRLALLGGTASDASGVLGFWESVTLAEAHLLLRDLPAARASYREAFARHASLSGSVGVARGQLARLLPLLGTGADVDALLAERP